MNSSITIRLCAGKKPILGKDEIVLLSPLVYDDTDFSLSLPPISERVRQEYLACIKKTIGGLAEVNSNQDWWYLPVSELQPIMSTMLIALELEARIKELIKISKNTNFILSVPNALVARYLMETNLGCFVTASIYDKLIWAVDNFKNIYRRYLNTIIWGIEHVLHIMTSENGKPFSKNIKTLFVTRFETDLESPNNDIYNSLWSDRYLGDLIEEGQIRGKIMVLGRCGGNPEKIAKFTSSYYRFPLRTIYQMLGFSDIATSLVRALRLKLISPNSSPLNKLIIIESRNHVRAVADCLLVELATDNLLKQTKPEQIICMQENSVWEHAIVRAAKKKSSKSIVIGYFHCPIMPSAFRYHNSPLITGRPMFDAIIPLGDSMADALCRLGPWKQLLWPGFGFRNPNINECLDLVSRPAVKPFRIVVLLGGMFNNAIFLKWVNRARIDLPRHHLLIKGHPVYGSENAIKGAGINLSKYNDIDDISSLSILDTLKMADCIVYKGTTVGISALAAGIPAIHIDDGGLQTDDTLFNSGGLSFSVSTPEDFCTVISNIINMENKTKQAWVKKAKKYAGQYYELSPRRRKKVLSIIFENNVFIQNINPSC